MLEIICWILIGFIFAIPFRILLETIRRKNPPPLPIPMKSEVQIIRPPGLSEDPEYQQLIRRLEIIPQKVLESVTNTTNQQKGKLGELIGYLHLNAQYDRLIVLKDITDFVGIRFPKGDDPGTIDFIDIKNGPYAKLSKEQTMLKKLVEARLVGFHRFKIETDGSASTSTEG